MLKQSNLKNKGRSGIMKQPNSNRILKQEDSEDEPMPMDYSSKMKSMASISNQIIDKNSNVKNPFEPKIPQIKKAEENKKTEFPAQEEEEEIQVPISYQIRQENKTNQNDKCISKNKYPSYNTARNDFSHKNNGIMNIQNINGSKSNSFKEDILAAAGDEVEDKPINLSEIKKFSLNSQVKSMNSNQSSNQVKSPENSEDTRNISDLNFNAQSSNPHKQQNNVNAKAKTKLTGGNKSNKNIDDYNQNDKGIQSISKNRTTSQERFGAEIENNFSNCTKENNMNNVMKSINNPINNYNTGSMNSAPLIKNAILNKIEKNLFLNSDLGFENRSTKSANLCESSVQPKKGDLTPKSIRSNNSEEAEQQHRIENGNKDKCSDLEEKGYLGNITLSELEENASVNVGIENINKNTTMNDLRLNSILSKNQFNNDNNDHNVSNHFLSNTKNATHNIRTNNINHADEIYEMLNQNKTATFKKTQDESLNSNLIITKGVKDQTTNFSEFRKNNNSNGNNNSNLNPSANLESNLSPESFIINSDKNNNLSVGANNYTNNNSHNVTRSDINLSHNTTQNNLKTQNSKMLLTESKYAQYDTQNLCYELVKEYSHLKIDKDEDFMRRMLFDVFKRQTKDERMEKLVEQNKVKMDENERIRTFNRLIEDANRRIEAQDRMEEMKTRLEMNNVNAKKYKFDEWEEIYQDRFLNYQKYKDQWIEERQREKKESEALREQEVIENCKTIKKPKEEIEQSVQRMYNEAERRLIKMDIKKNKNKMDDNKMDIEDFFMNNNSNNYLNAKEPRNMTPTVFRPNNKNKKKQANNYQFQSDMSGNENSEDESNNFLSKVKIIKEMNNVSNSPIKKKSPGQKPNYINQNALIKESVNEDLEEASVNISYATNYSKKILNANNIKNKSSVINNNNNQKSGWNSLNNSKNPKQSLNNKIITNNTDINNKRFEIDPMENKRNIVNNALNKNKTTGNGNYTAKSDVTRSYKSKNNNPINAVPHHLTNLQEYEEDETIDNKNNFNSYALKHEMNRRPLSRGSNNNQQQKSHNNVNKGGEHNLKHMPDHLASKFVDEILNSKFSEGD